MKDTKTVFIEYSTFRKGQHFMTVVHVEKGKRQIIGRIFKVYDKEKEKFSYYAKDWAGNDVFVDTKDIYALKKNFIECGKTMVMSIPAGPNQKEHDDFPYSEKTGKKQTPKEKTSRENELKQAREKSKPTEKGKETKVEKEHDDKLENEHDEKYKNGIADKDDPDYEEYEAIKEQYGDEFLERGENWQREQELEEIRERDNDHEKDQDIDQEIDR